MTVRTRFAPSPTGELHLGNVRTAVLNWLYARHCGGQFIVRIEDTDLDRNVEGSEEEILSSLRRLGLDWDEGQDIGGGVGPYRQSERSEIYHELAERLVSDGSAFRCYCSASELDAKKQAATARGEYPVYDGTCHDLSGEEERRKRDGGIVPSIRFYAPYEDVVVHDLTRGEITFDAAEFGDFVILKSDGTPTYNFAVVVDDLGMKITHVIRGVGHLSNTPRQLMIYSAIGSDPPVFIHIPHVLDPDGSPLSKRRGARSLRQYLDDGFHPDALINYLSLLSWSSPSGEEVLPPQRLIEEIELARIGVSDVMLDPDKLEWLSGEYIRRMKPDDLSTKIEECLGPSAMPDQQGHSVFIAAALQKRINTFCEARRFLPQFYPPDPMQWSEEALASMRGGDAARVLEAIYSTLKGVEDWTGETAVAGIRSTGLDIGVKGRGLFMPIRAAVTGATGGPELPDIFDVQGKATSLRVLEQSLLRIGRAPVGSE